MACRGRIVDANPVVGLELKMNDLVTKSDFREAMSELKASLARQSLCALAALTAVFIIVAQ